MFLIFSSICSIQLSLFPLSLPSPRSLYCEVGFPPLLVMFPKELRPLIYKRLKNKQRSTKIKLIRPIFGDQTNSQISRRRGIVPLQGWLRYENMSSINKRWSWLWCYFRIDCFLPLSSSDWIQYPFNAYISMPSSFEHLQSVCVRSPGAIFGFTIYFG